MTRFFFPLTIIECSKKYESRVLVFLRFKPRFLLLRNASLFNFSLAAKETWWLNITLCRHNAKSRDIWTTRAEKVDKCNVRIFGHIEHLRTLDSRFD